MDDPTQTVVMHRSEPSRLQSLALQLADKINNFVESNERILETKQGNFFLRGANQVSTRIHFLLQEFQCFVTFFRAISVGTGKIIEVETRKIGIVKEETTGGIINFLYCLSLFNLSLYVSKPQNKHP